MKRLLIVCLGIFSFNICAQTNVPVLVTNFVTAHKDFRRVNGQLYNIQKSYLWWDFRGEAISKTNGVVIFKTLIERSRTVSGGAQVNDSQEHGLFGIGNGIPTSSRKETWTEPGRTIALTNVPNYNEVAAEVELTFRAMEVGVYDYGSKPLELWDCGIPNVVAVVTTNFPSAKNSLRQTTHASD